MMVMAYSVKIGVAYYRRSPRAIGGFVLVGSLDRASQFQTYEAAKEIASSMRNRTAMVVRAQQQMELFNAVLRR